MLMNRVKQQSISSPCLFAVALAATNKKARMQRLQDESASWPAGPGDRVSAGSCQSHCRGRYARRFIEQQQTELRKAEVALNIRVRRATQLAAWSKATELAKVARREDERFASATWVHKAKELSKEEFKREAERHLTGRETEAWELLYFKLYKSQLAVIEQALETAALMLGSDKSRCYCLEMICADFLAGANLSKAIPMLCLCQLADCWRCYYRNIVSRSFSKSELRLESLADETSSEAAYARGLPAATPGDSLA
jgi:hypothetical protein